MSASSRTSDLELDDSPDLERDDGAAVELDDGAVVGLALAGHLQVGGMAFGRVLAMGCARLLDLERVLDVGLGPRRLHLHGGVVDLGT